ncbi:MAG: tetratricopeptide repeat protein [Candidatus Acidiferrales bacterium]
MRRNSHTCIAILAIAILAGLGTGCAKLQARDKLNHGVQAYTGGHYDEAIELFKQSKALDPDLMNARLYLAAAYASQYIPGAPSEDNVRMGNQAIEEYKEVLEKDPNNLNAIDGIGGLLYNMGGTPFDRNKFEESKKYHMMHINQRPQDPEPYYWIGVIDWSLTYRANKEARANYNANARKTLREEEPMAPAVRDDFAKNYGSLIDEGIADLNKAIEIKPDYDDAMAYLNLLYRQKADTETTADARANDVKLAEELVSKVKEIKQNRLLNPTPSS